MMLRCPRCPPHPSRPHPLTVACSIVARSVANLGQYLLNGSHWRVLAIGTANANTVGPSRRCHAVSALPVPTYLHDQMMAMLFAVVPSSQTPLPPPPGPRLQGDVSIVAYPANSTTSSSSTLSPSRSLLTIPASAVQGPAPSFGGEVQLLSRPSLDTVVRAGSVNTLAHSYTVHRARGQSGPVAHLVRSCAGDCCGVQRRLGRDPVRLLHHRRHHVQRHLPPHRRLQVC
jgi:hypothetical protein